MKQSSNNVRDFFESRIAAGATEKLLGWQKPHALTVAWSYDIEGHATQCVERYCELANKKVEQLHKVSHPCLDDHQFKQEELESVGECLEVCSQLVLKCLYLARIGRPDILCSVNKLARSDIGLAELTDIVESGYGPNQFDNFDYSETLAAIFQNESVDIDTEPSYSCDAELDDELIGKALSSPLFTQEREEPTNQTQTCHSHEKNLLPAQSFVTRTNTERPVYEPGSNLCQKRKSSGDLKNERTKILLERQTE